MAKDLTKEGLGNILNTVVGMKPKTLPANLEKNDIVLYRNKLYKYKGEPKQVSIVSESEFKKAGLRFMGGDYKVSLLNDILELYKWMYQSGLNGHKLGSDWGERPKVRMLNYYFDYTKDERYVRNSNQILGVFKRFFNINKFSDMFEFPIKIIDEKKKEVILKNSAEEDNFINNLNIDGLFSIKKIFNSNVLKKEKEYNLLKSNIDNFEKFQNLLNSNQIHILNVRDVEVKSYETFWYYFTKLNDFSFKNMIVNDEYSFSIYQKDIPKRIYNLKLKPLSEFLVKVDLGRDSNDNERLEVTKWSILEDNGWRMEGFSFRFFLPYFIDAVTNNTAKEMNEKYNKYGVFFQGKEDGEYTLSFKVCMSTRDQHEEEVSGAGNWGDMYAFSPTRNKVRQEDETWVVWKKNDLISFELNWKVENGAAKDWRLKLLDENKRNTQGLDNFMKWIQVETFENYLFLQLFYAVYSLDDAGGWNEWQFAHILPPFNLEFKGE